MKIKKGCVRSKSLRDKNKTPQETGRNEERYKKKKKLEANLIYKRNNKYKLKGYLN
jgi:hypothetical protein